MQLEKRHSNGRLKFHWKEGEGLSDHGKILVDLLVYHLKEYGKQDILNNKERRLTEKDKDTVAEAFLSAIGRISKSGQELREGDYRKAVKNQINWMFDHKKVRDIKENHYGCYRNKIKYRMYLEGRLK